MPRLPQRISLVAETERFLRRAIGASQWKHHLPGERHLCGLLKVSRWTLRTALRGLAGEGLIRIRPSQPSAIIAKPSPRGRRCRPWTIGCVIPMPFLELRPFLYQSLSEIRASVLEQNGEIAFYHSPLLYCRDCGRALAELTSRNPHDCWIVVRSGPEMQAWFQKSRLPVIICGSLYPGINLPSVGTDYHAMGRHVAGRALARGHDNIALLVSKCGPSVLPSGLGQLEMGMRAVLSIRKEVESKPRFTVFRHRYDDPADVSRSIGRMLEMEKPPTFAMVCESTTFLTVVTCLAQRDWIVPRDLSVVVGDWETYHRHIVPRLSHYSPSAEALTRNLLRLIHRALDHTLAPNDGISILPRFVEGETFRYGPAEAGGTGVADPPCAGAKYP